MDWGAWLKERGSFGRVDQVISLRWLQNCWNHAAGGRCDTYYTCGYLCLWCCMGFCFLSPLQYFPNSRSDPGKKRGKCKRLLRGRVEQTEFGDSLGMAVGWISVKDWMCVFPQIHGWKPCPPPWDEPLGGEQGQMRPWGWGPWDEINVLERRDTRELVFLSREEIAWRGPSASHRPNRGHPGLGPPAPRTVGKWISVVWAAPSAVSVLCPQWTDTVRKREWSGFSAGSGGEESPCNAGDLSSIPGLGRSPGEGKGYPLQYSCLENPLEGGAWWAIVHGVPKSQTRLSD